MKNPSNKIVCGLLMVVLALAVGVGNASAGDDPYGTTTTSTEPSGGTPTCNLSVTSGAPGTSVTATVTNVPLGQTVRLLFAGREVGRVTAPSGVVPAGPTTTMQIAFRVPQLRPGSYLVTAVGATFTAPCGPGEGGRFELLAAVVDRGGDGSLPRTGIYVGLLLVVAVALLLAGRAFTAEAKRRRRAARSAGPRHRAGV